MFARPSTPSTHTSIGGEGAAARILLMTHFRARCATSHWTARLQRKWLLIDNTVLACALLKRGLAFHEELSTLVHPGHLSITRQCSSKDTTERDRRPHLIGWSMRITLNVTWHHHDSLSFLDRCSPFPRYTENLVITAMNQAESMKNFASYTITEGFVVSIFSVMHIVGYVLWD